MYTLKKNLSVYTLKKYYKIESVACPDCTVPPGGGDFQKNPTKKPKNMGKIKKYIKKDISTQKTVKTEKTNTEKRKNT